MMFAYVYVFIFGLLFGSFINAFVWRLYQQEKLRSSKKPKNLAAAKREFSILRGRSMCVDCHHTLAWYDLIPVVSWLSLRGACRYCKKPISLQYPVVEVITAILFTLSLYAWPYSLGSIGSYMQFGIWLTLIILWVSLALYDIKWMILPTHIVYTAFAGVSVFVAVTAYLNGITAITSALLGSLGLGGLFWLLYQISQGKWIGGGDVRLGFVIGALLGWQKALLGLSLAAYIGTVVILIAVVAGKYRRNMKLPFGPLLLAGMYISFLWGQDIIDWYLRLIGLQ